MDFATHVIGEEPPPHNEQLNEYWDKIDKTKFLLTTQLNFAEYQLGQAYTQHYDVRGKEEAFWVTTRAGCFANAQLAINYYHICNKFFGILYSNVRYVCKYTCRAFSLLFFYTLSPFPLFCL